MSEKPEATTVCKWCGTPLPLNYSGPCPKCGKEGKIVFLTLKESAPLKYSLNCKVQKEFFEKNSFILCILITITLASSLIGFILSGVIGIIIGIGLGILSLLLGPYAIIKVREIRESHSD